MEKKSFMIAIVAIIAVILVGAGVYVLLNNGDDPEPEPTPTQNYSILYEVVGEDGVVYSFNTVTFESEATLSAYVSAANKALEGTGIVFGDNGWIKYNDGSNNATYVLKDGAWVEVTDTSSDYCNNSSAALMVGNGYINDETYADLPDDLKSGYKSTGYSGAYAYIKLVDSEFTHGILYEIIDENGKVTGTGNVIFTVTDTTQATYVAAANKALEGTGIVFGDSGWITYNDGGNNATYVLADDDWKFVNSSIEYCVNAVSALMVGNGYINEATYTALSDYEKSGYKSTGWGEPYAYAKLVDDSVDYTIFYEVIDENGKVTGSDSVSFTAIAALSTYVAAANKALEGTGIVFNERGWATYNDGGTNATYVLKDGEWVAVSISTDYFANDTTALMVGNGYINETAYNALSDDEKAGYKSTGWGGAYAYMKLVDEFKDYKILYEVIDDAGKVTETNEVFFSTPAFFTTYIVAANKALEGTGLVFNEKGWIKYNDGSNNATYVLKDGGWVTVSSISTDYCNSSSAALMVGNGYISETVYNALSDEEKAGYEESGMGSGAWQYIKIPDFPA